MSARLCRPWRAFPVERRCLIQSFLAGQAFQPVDRGSIAVWDLKFVSIVLDGYQRQTGMSVLPPLGYLFQTIAGEGRLINLFRKFQAQRFDRDLRLSQKIINFG